MLRQASYAADVNMPLIIRHTQTGQPLCCNIVRGCAVRHAPTGQSICCKHRTRTHARHSGLPRSPIIMGCKGTVLRGSHRMAHTVAYQCAQPAASQCMVSANLPSRKYRSLRNNYIKFDFFFFVATQPCSGEQPGA